MRRLVILVSFTCLFCCAASALPIDDNWCGYDPEVERVQFTYGPSVRAKFIFIDFNDGPVFDYSPMEVGLQQAVVDTVKWWLQSHTQQQFTFTEDSGIVFHLGDDFSDGTAAPWTADLTAAQYANSSPVPDWYLCRWKGGGSCDPDSLIADISSWWSTPNVTISSLMSEVLYKIYAEYHNENPEDWPFGDHSEYTGEPDAVDLLFMVFMTHDSPYGNYGGTLPLPVRVAGLTNFDSDFFGNLKSYGSYLQGTGQMHNTVDLDYLSPFIVGNCGYAILHEFSHSFNWYDGPPNLYGIPSGAIYRYYYGGLNVTCQHYVPGPGIPVASLHNLANLSIPWVDVVDFTGVNLRDVVLYDLRYREGSDAGKIYKFQLENPSNPASPQWFLFAYHAGYGVDAQSDPVEGPLIPGRGLEVQHVAKGGSQYANIVDIESAFGLFRNISIDSLPPISIPPEFSNPMWNPNIAENRARGFDNYDLWWVDNDSTSLRALGECAPGWYPCWALDYGRLHSQQFDFFTADTLRSGEVTWTKPEFSFRTNPNCFWYADGWHTSYSYRFNQQRIPNSLIVRIKEQHDDYDPNREIPGPHMIVDFLSAPYENIVYPNGGETLRTDEPVTIEWEHTFDEITTVDILFSPDGGSTYPDSLTIATGVTASAGQYTWAPNANYSSEAAVIKVVYHHDLETSYLGDDASDDTFVMFGASRAVFENTLDESELDIQGNPYSSVGFESNYSEQAGRNYEDLMVTIASSGQRSALNRPYGMTNNGVPRFYDATSEAFTYDITPQIGLGGISVADMDNDGDLDMFCAAGASTSPSVPHLYRNNGDGTFADVTDSLGLSSLAANSWAGAWGDYDSDGWVDLLIARGGEPGVPPESMDSRPAYLLRNGLDPILGTGNFEDVTAAVGLTANSANIVASISACWGDINNDGRLDLYLADYRLNPAGVCGKLFVQQSDGSFLDETSSRLTIGLLVGQAAAQFADMDLDGNLDLVVGTRLAGVGAYVFWNNGSGYFNTKTPASLPPLGGVSGMKIWDQDLDLRPDLLLTTRDAQETSHFFHNHVVDSETVLLDETVHVGLDDGHEAGGLTVLDWNRDGDKDLYVGRPTTAEDFFYRTTNEEGDQDLGKSFINVKLSSPQSVNNQAAIGARVSIEVGAEWHHQWVDGGSGRGGQDDLTLTFPVPATTGTYPVQILWPNGWVQDYDADVRHYDSQNLVGDDPEVIEDDTNPSVESSTVTFSSLWDPDLNRVKWVFTWQTKYRSDWSLDRVNVGASSCGGAAEYTPATSGAEHSILRLSTGKYQHTLIVPVTCQAPCTIPYTVTSAHPWGNSVISSTSSQKSFKIIYCPQQL